jgi:superfamily I DNA and/or RNA helicase
MEPAFSKLRTVIIDEAGTVPETKMPLLLTLSPDCLQRIIAIGDQNQLAPFSRVQSEPSSRSSGSNDCFEFNRKGYCSKGKSCRFDHNRQNRYASHNNRGNAGDTADTPMSFFQRIEKVLQKGSIPTLTEQFRMHPTISNFVSRTFYKNNLMTNPLVHASRVQNDPVGLWWLEYGDNDAETVPKRSTSKVNRTEAILALDMLDRRDLIGKSVMIITFYKAQEALLKKMLLERKKEVSDQLRILSVDQSQGSEADVVILSCVRSNLNKSIGFVRNANRMNVAVSRIMSACVLDSSLSEVRQPCALTRSG